MKRETKGEVMIVRKLLNEDLTFNCYEIVIDCLDLPKICLGKCKIVQEEKK